MKGNLCAAAYFAFALVAVSGHANHRVSPLFNVKCIISYALGSFPCKEWCLEQSETELGMSCITTVLCMSAQDNSKMEVYLYNNGDDC